MVGPSRNAQCLVLCSGITSGSAQVTICGAGDQNRVSTNMSTSALTSALFLQLQTLTLSFSPSLRPSFLSMLA